MKDSDSAELYDNNLELLIEKVVFIYEKFFDVELNEEFKEIILNISFRCNPELYLQYISKYLHLKKSYSLVQVILFTMKNTFSRIEPEKLNLLVPSFINGLFDCLNHHISDVRKYSVYCIVEVYLIIGTDFEEYLNEINQSQKNLINIFYRKRLSENV